MDIESATAIVERTERNWRECGLRNDVEGLLNLYAEDALFFGSLPHMFVGRLGIAEYFANVPLGAARSITFFGREVRMLGDDVIAASSYVFFDLELEDGPVRWRFGMSWTLERHQGAWKIASHHASPREA